jgi:type IV pilus assembly protein PilB
VATSVHLICAQRLIRRVCKECKEEVKVPPQALVDIGFPPQEAPKIKVFKGRGCPTCNNTGYKGRLGVYEVMEIGESLREMILTGASTIELKKKAMEEGMLTLRGSGLQKLREGATTIEEVVRETVL